MAAGFKDENIVILGDLDATTQTAIKKQKRLAAYALGEIDRMIGAFGLGGIGCGSF